MTSGLTISATREVRGGHLGYRVMETTTRGRVRVQASPKRVRGYSSGELVFDTLGALLVWEGPHYPQYYVPLADVRAALSATGETRRSPSRGNSAVMSMLVAGREIFDAALLFGDSPVDELRDHVRFRWEALDSWFEEDVEIFTHPRSPYVRVDILPTSRRVRVEVDGVTIADSVRARVLFETGLRPRYYLPFTDVRMDLLTPTDLVTHCPYKGAASYWSVAATEGGTAHRNVLWSYRSPLPESAGIVGLAAFYDERVDVYIDEVRVPR